MGHWLWARALFLATRDDHFIFYPTDDTHFALLVGGGLLRSIGGWSALKAMRDAETRVISDERILGSSEFVEMVLKSANEAYERRAAIQAQGIDLIC